MIPISVIEHREVIKQIPKMKVVREETREHAQTTIEMVIEVKDVRQV